MEIKEREYFKGAMYLDQLNIYRMATPEVMQAEIAKLETFTLFGEEYISTMTGAVKKAEIVGLDFGSETDKDGQLRRYRIVTRGGAEFDVRLSFS